MLEIWATPLLHTPQGVLTFSVYSFLHYLLFRFLKAVLMFVKLAAMCSWWYSVNVMFWSFVISFYIWCLKCFLLVSVLIITWNVPAFNFGIICYLINCKNLPFLQFIQVFSCFITNILCLFSLFINIDIWMNLYFGDLILVR